MLSAGYVTYAADSLIQDSAEWMHYFFLYRGLNRFNLRSHILHGRGSCTYFAAWMKACTWICMYTASVHLPFIRAAVSISSNSVNGILRPKIRNIMYFGYIINLASSPTSARQTETRYSWFVIIGKMISCRLRDNDLQWVAVKFSLGSVKIHDTPITGANRIVKCRYPKRIYHRSLRKSPVQFSLIINEMEI